MYLFYHIYRYSYNTNVSKIQIQDIQSEIYLDTRYKDTIIVSRYVSRYFVSYILPCTVYKYIYIHIYIYILCITVFHYAIGEAFILHFAAFSMNEQCGLFNHLTATGQLVDPAHAADVAR